MSLHSIFNHHQPSAVAPTHHSITVPRLCNNHRHSSHSNNIFAAQRCFHLQVDLLVDWLALRGIKMVFSCREAAVVRQSRLFCLVSCDLFARISSRFSVSISTNGAVYSVEITNSTMISRLCLSIRGFWRGKHLAPNVFGHENVWLQMFAGQEAFGSKCWLDREAFGSKYWLEGEAFGSKMLAGKHLAPHVTRQENIWHQWSENTWLQTSLGRKPFGSQCL